MNIEGSSAEELTLSVRAHVDSGSLLPGTSLPSIRALAEELGLNRNTVAAAYAQLAAAGVVESRRRGGTIVLGAPAVDGEGRTAGTELINLASGNPDPELLPSLTRRSDEAYTPLLYGAAPISPRVQEWADAHLSTDVGEPHRLVLTHGAMDGIQRLLTAHLTRGDRVAVEDPCFLTSLGLLKVDGYRGVPVPVDAEGMTVAGLRAALESGARAVVCTPRAHNPTGASLTAERAMQLRSLLAGHPSVLVIEDDHFSAISAEPYRRITPEGSRHWALVRSVSKFLGPDLRLAFVLTTPDTASRLESRLSAASTWVSHILQNLVIDTLTDTSTAALLEGAGTAYQERNQSLRTALDAHGIATWGRSDGLNVWVPDLTDPVATAADLAELGWAVRTGESFAVTGHPPSAIRVTTSTLTPDQATRFASDLAAALGA
ncbi:aminotransferase class I/II-fold pyridoxal phosphate-dependent enzyme [Homoserinimonas sp. A447]